MGDGHAVHEMIVPDLWMSAPRPCASLHLASVARAGACENPWMIPRSELARMSYLANSLFVRNLSPQASKFYEMLRDSEGSGSTCG